MSIKEELKATGWIFALLIASLVNLLVLSFLLGKVEESSRIKIFIGGYIAILIAFYFMKKKFNWRIIDYMIFILGAPIILFVGTLRIIFPVISLLFHTILFFFIALIPALILLYLQKAGYLGISDGLTHYIGLTSFSVLTILFYLPLTDFCHFISEPSSREPESEIYKDSKAMKKHFLSKENIRFVLYTVYVILLILSSVKILGKNPDDINIDYSGKVLLQAFATFLAFDRVVLHFNKLEFTASQLKHDLLRGINYSPSGNKKEKQP
jgi:hypothetical protein